MGKKRYVEVLKTTRVVKDMPTLKTPRDICSEKANEK
jgi:hypothetical protein